LYIKKERRKGIRNWKEELYSLARSIISPFKPDPYLPNYIDIYLPESDQPLLFQFWEEQLKEFKTKI
jgi:hypothetical protein